MSRKADWVWTDLPPVFYVRQGRISVEVLALSKETDQKRETFFKLLFGQTSGFFCLAFLESAGKKFTEEFYRYPEELDIITTRINREIHGHNIYFCSQLLSQRDRVKETVLYTPNVWADLDKCPPEKMLLEPSLVLETSPDKYQAFWRLDRDDYDPDDVEDLSRRVAYKHAEDGADTGWALTKLLRVPYTYNYKYSEPKIVKIIGANRNEYSPDQFNADYPPTEEYINVNLPVPVEADDSVTAEDILEDNHLKISEKIWALFSTEPEAGADWSRLLWRLLMLLQEAGLTNEQVFTVAKSAKCNKYRRDGRPVTQLWKDVVRAGVRVQAKKKALASPEKRPTVLLNDQERALIEASPKTFVERYITWASGLTDAAPQYHQAGAIMALSSVISGGLKLPTSFGNIVPNIWFMILGNTTLTRKTSSMDIAMDLIMNVDDDIVLATDGSIEGLLTSLSSRPGQPSIFLRDEFSGLLEQMTKKDYMSGMMELLTKLYDGKMQKRVLRSGTVEVRNPRLLIYAGGIRNNITSALTMEHVLSGFVPRFVFIIATDDISRLRPMGPPTDEDIDAKAKILAELQLIYDAYNQTQPVTLPNGTVANQKVNFEAQLTQEAWDKYNDYNSILVKDGINSEDPDATTPMNERLSNSILKVAILIAASRQIQHEFVVVEEIDIIRAAKYGEQWWTDSKVIGENIGLGTNERFLKRIMDKVNRSPNGVLRSKLMQTLHLTAKECTFALETLKQRDLIHITKLGNGEIIKASALAEAENEQA